jgi:hypothetical protein
VRILALAPRAIATEARSLGAHHAAIGERLIGEEACLRWCVGGARTTDIGHRALTTLIGTARIFVVAVATERAVLTKPIMVSIDAGNTCIHATTRWARFAGARGEKHRNREAQGEATH